MVKKVFMLIICLLLSISFVSVSPFFDTTNVKSYEDMRNGKFGLPIPFVYQDLLVSGVGGFEGDFPHRFSMQMDFLDNDIDFKFRKLNFVVSVIIVYAVLFTIYVTWLKMIRV